MPRQKKGTNALLPPTTIGSVSVVTHEMAIDPLDLLTKDVKNTAKTLTDKQARVMVDYYYQVQDWRIRAVNQEAAQDEAAEPHELVTFLANNFQKLENNIKACLGIYADSKEVGEWARSQIGIGPVIAAGLIAHIDPKYCATAGGVWRFAGLDPSVKWEKGKKRPWNADLKTLCWKIGESFIKVSGKEDAVYGKVYKQAKEEYTAKNERGDYAEDAARILTEKKWDKKTEAYGHLSSGKLPPAQIHARARRYAVKLFLSHFAQVYWESTTGQKAPLPWAIQHGGHAHLISPPNWNFKEAS